VVVMGVDSFIATLATGSLIQAFITMMTNDIAITSPALTGPFAKIGQARIGGITLPVIYTLVVALVIWFVLEHTATGRRLYATGFNPESARGGLPRREPAAPGPLQRLGHADRGAAARHRRRRSRPGLRPELGAVDVHRRGPDRGARHHRRQAPRPAPGPPGPSRSSGVAPADLTIQHENTVNPARPENPAGAAQMRTSR
jgi:hypothetical protein